jgi:hypothetical protein
LIFLVREFAGNFRAKSLKNRKSTNPKYVLLVEVMANFMKEQPKTP